jgi:hypothetical protein
MMLNQLSEQIRECHEHAEYCERKAAQQTNPELRQDFVTLAELWRNLARSYEFTERATDFSNEATRQVNDLPGRESPKSPDKTS